MDYNKLKVVDLKVLLKNRKLSTTGRKDELILRLERDDNWVPVSEIDFSKVIFEKWVPPVKKPHTSPKSRHSHTILEYHKLKIPELKVLLKKRRLPISGAKAVLITRLEESDVIYSEDYKLEYPKASSFVTWLRNNMIKFKIPFKEIDTQSDFYKFKIGGESYYLDWKHLSTSEIAGASELIEPYGYGIEYRRGPDTKYPNTVRWILLEN